MLPFIANIKKLVERLPEKGMGKSWLLERLEVWRCAVSVTQASHEFQELGGTVAERLERDKSAGKLQMLLIATRQLQKVFKRLSEVSVPEETPVEGLSFKDLVADDSDGIQMTHGVHVAGGSASWKATLSREAPLTDVLASAAAGLLWIDAEKMERASKTLEQAQSGFDTSTACWQ